MCLRYYSTLSSSLDVSKYMRVQELSDEKSFNCFWNVTDDRRFSISGSNIDTTDGSTANTVSAGTITSGVYNPGTIAATQDTAGAAFSFSQSYTQADAVPTSAPTVGQVPNFSSVTSYTAGSAGDLAGTVTSAGVLTVTAGGPGSTATGQYVSEITVID